MWTWERLSEQRAEFFESNNPGGAYVGLVSNELSRGVTPTSSDISKGERRMPFTDLP